MEKSAKTIWFKGSNQINCEIKDVKDSFANMGKHFTDVIKLMPGMKEVELIEQGKDYVTIKTNEGLMKRTNISINVEEEKITMEFDEEYKAGKTITTHSHFLDEFSVSNSLIIHHLVISNVKAPGFMGFFYKNFGSSNIGKAFIDAYMNYLSSKYIARTKK